MNNFIEAKEFLELQPEVQKVLKDYMKDKYQYGDKVYVKHEDEHIGLILKPFNTKPEDYGYYVIIKDGEDYMWVPEYVDWMIPLFQMHHLIQFIEDKTGSKVDIDHHIDGYYISLGSETRLENFYETLEHDPLSALWIVAIKIAMEVNHE